MRQKITGFHQDEFEHWVADLACGHTQHVRHDPPWQSRPWVISAQQRQKKIGFELDCVVCDATDSDETGIDQTGIDVTGSEVTS